MSNKIKFKFPDKKFDLKNIKINLKMFNKNNKVYKNKIISLEDFINPTLPSRQ